MGIRDFERLEADHRPERRRAEQDLRGHQRRERAADRVEPANERLARAARGAGQHDRRAQRERGERGEKPCARHRHRRQHASHAGQHDVAVQRIAFLARLHKYQVAAIEVAVAGELCGEIGHGARRGGPRLQRGDGAVDLQFAGFERSLG